jgi:homocysteine S-methyltransferase
MRAALADGVLLLDGGLATTLEALGVDINDKLWSGKALEVAPDKVLEAHELFVAAGCDVISTASYQVPGERPDMLRKSVQLARSAGARFVAASLGPYGAHLADGSEYHGAYRTLPDAERLLKDYHFPRLAVVLSEKPDVLLFETIPCVVEARAIVALLREVNAEAIVSFQCRDDSHLASGEPLEEALAVLLDCSLVIGAGVNCVPPRRDAHRQTRVWSASVAGGVSEQGLLVRCREQDVARGQRLERGVARVCARIAGARMWNGGRMLPGGLRGYCSAATAHVKSMG